MTHAFARVLACGVLAATTSVGPAFGQQEPAVPAPERLTPAEVVRLFDAYVVVQAQEQLGLDTQQYGMFVAHYKAVLDARRRNQEARLRILGELGALVRRAGAAPDEDRLKDRLKALQDQEAAGAADVRKALDAVEQELTVLQRARFRIFEEQMERRKFELLTRARQANRGARRQPPLPRQP